MRLVGAEQLEDIAVGAAVLGTGGGGDPYIGKLMAQQAIRRHGPVRLMDPDEIGDDDLVLPAGMMGAPTVMVEKSPSGQEIVRAFQALESYLGRKAAATMSTEAGGLNSTTPFTVAATLGIPLVDADMMGRAFPELQMCTPTMYGISATPMAIADEKGNSTVVNGITNAWTERIARSTVIDMGCTAMISLYPMTGKQVREAAVARTITQVEEIGRAIREARGGRRDPVEAVLDATGGFLVFEGKVSDVRRRTETGFARGELAIAGAGEHAGETMEIHFQNEFLIARVGDDVRVVTPDLITLLDRETGKPITTESMRYGFRVAVVGIACDPRWRSEAGLDLVGPRFFGYDAEYAPVELRYGR